MLVLKLITILGLILVFIQDMKSRAVSWVIFPLLAVALLLLYGLDHRGLGGKWIPALFNTIFLVLQLVLISIYFSLRNRKWTNVSGGLLGWGDILLLFCCAFYLSALNFLLFYISSLILVILIWSLAEKRGVKESRGVPLAGLQALFFGVFLIQDWTLHWFSLTDDYWLLNLMTR
ncbi:MAG TPA: hypothetical protein VIM89_08050 [Mucilaginibacter sp.]